MLSVWPRAIGGQRRGTRAELDRHLGRIDVDNLCGKRRRHDYCAPDVALDVFGLDRDAALITTARNVSAAESRLCVRPAAGAERELPHPTSGDRRFRRRFTSGRRSGQTARKPSPVDCRDGRPGVRVMRPTLHRGVVQRNTRYVAQCQMGCSTVFQAVVLAVSLLTAGCAVPQRTRGDIIGCICRSITRVRHRRTRPQNGGHWW